MDAVGLGFSVHTGWAIGVIASRRRVLARARLSLYDDPQRFAYHASQLQPAKAQELIASAERIALKNAKAAVRELVGELKPVAGLGRPRALPELTAILRAHPLLHTAEGELYRAA